MNPVRLTQPTRAVETVEAPAGLPVPRGKTPPSKYVYAVYPRGWDYTEGFGFLPILKKIIGKPGCNGVNDAGDMTRVLAGVASKGGVYISPDDSRLGEYVGYVQYYDTRCGRKWYVDFCQEATVLPSGEVLWNGNDTSEAWNKFRAAIRDSGIVPGILREVYLDLQARDTRTLEALAGRAAHNPSLQAKYQACEKKLVGMAGAWDALVKKEAATAPKAKAVRRRASSKEIEG
jgi:hypothetical protein